MSCARNKSRGGIMRINLRIAALFSVLFALTALLLLGGIYYTLKTSLDQEDEAFIRHKLLQYWAQSQTRPVGEFISALDGSAVELEATPYFLRVADRENNTIFFMFPQGWKNFFPMDAFEEALKPGEGGLFRIRAPQHGYTLMCASIRLEEEYILQIGVSTEPAEKMIRLIIRNFAMLLVPLLVASLAGGAVLTARMLAPIQKLAEAAGSIIGTGDLSARISEGRAHDELHDLVLLFNRMLEHIEALVRGMKGTLDTVAHDLRTPLTRLRGMAELALAGPGDARSFREALQDCLEEADRILTDLNAIMDLCEAETGILRLLIAPTDIARQCRQLIEMYSYIAEERNIRITLDGAAEGETVEALVDAARFRRVIGNLLDNAVKYSPDGAQVRVELCKEDGGGLLLRVIDHGPGIPREEAPHIWERLYRGAGAAGKPGLGIGLSIAKAITEAHGGTLRAVSPAEGGTVFELRIPAR